jgi:hypothetical protein
LLGGTEHHSEKKPGYPMSWKNFEAGNSLIHAQRVADTLKYLLKK